MNVSTLIIKAQHDDQEAMGALVQKFEPKLRSTVFSSPYSNKADCEDMEQELTIKIIEGVQKFDIDQIPGFWEYLAHVKGEKFNKYC